MAVIKNKAKLVERAAWHAHNDHIVQGTYGRGDVNGHAEFKGCVIGCLATPHGESALVEWLREATIGERGSDGLGFVYIQSEELVHDISEEFGICDELLRKAEACFESLEKHGAAINFVPAFARALPEGVDVDDTKVYRLWDAIRYLDFDPEERADEFLKRLAALGK